MIVELEEKLEALLSEINTQLEKCQSEEQRFRLIKEANSIIAKLIRLRRMQTRKKHKHTLPIEASFDSEGFKVKLREVVENGR